MRNARNLFSAAVWRLRALVARVSARRRTQAALATARPQALVVVCYGNVYRSALAGALLQRRLAPAILVRSAGFHGRTGRAPSERLLRLARAHGLDLSAHRSRRFDGVDAAIADLVVLMDRGQWARLRRMGVPEAKLVWLGAMVPGPVEIGDPWQMEDAAAERILERVIACACALADRLMAGTR